MLNMAELRRHAASILLVLVAVPLAWLSISGGLAWEGRTFPSFFVGPTAIIPSVSGVDWPRDKESLFHAQVASIDGVAVHSGADVYRIVASEPVGTKFRFGFRKGTEYFEKTIGSRRFGLGDYIQTWGITSGFGICTILMGLVVAGMQPTNHQARVFRRMAGIGGLYALTGVFLHQAEPVVLAALCLALECLFPAAFLHLAMVFPQPQTFGRHTRRVRALPWVASCVLIAVVLRGYWSSPPDLLPLRAVYIYMAASIALFIAAMATSWFGTRDRIARARIAALLPGLIFGTTAMLFAFLNNSFSGGNFPVQLPLVATLIFYASIAWSITRHELFGIDRVIRQSFVYGALSIVILAGYALAILLPRRLFPATGTDGPAMVGGIFIILLAFLFDPLRRAVQVAVDRAFFRSAVDHRATISALSERLTTLLDRRQISASVAELATGDLELESASLVLDSPQGARLWHQDAGSTLTESPADPALCQASAQLSRSPQTFDAERIIPGLEREDPAAARAVAELKARLAFPLVVGGESVGLLAFGAKRSGREIASEEIALLRTLSHQAAIALANARSYEELAVLNRELDAKVQQRTAELADAYDELKNAQAQLVQSEKLASLGEFVAGAAHELNNPASFVRGSLQILTEFLSVLSAVLEIYSDIPIPDETLRERLAAARSGRNLDDILRETPELLRICNEGAERIERTVSELKVFVRKDRGDRAAVDMAANLEATLNLLAARIRDEGITIEREFADAPIIEADSAALGQVWMNLLANALDALRDCADPRIRIALSGGDDGMVEVRIEDSGPGIDPSIRDRLFEPFATTKKIGEGTGLGLSIAYGAIQSHAGTLEAGISDLGGAAFVVRLPTGA